jgi:hypothetical protein
VIWRCRWCANDMLILVRRWPAEKLAEVHGCTISRETLRGWMIAAGLWIDRRHRLPAPHQPRRPANAEKSAPPADGGRRSRLLASTFVVGVSGSACSGGLRCEVAIGPVG